MRDPIIIFVKGDWRTGKTDTSLLIGHLCLKWGIIDELGTNIYTYNNPRVQFINTTGKLKHWLHRNDATKLFIFDEGLKHAYKRKAMSSKNISLITDILPEISKGHGRMLLLSQIESLDSDLMHPAFVRAEFTKQSKKVMTTKARDYPPRTFTKLPSCQSVIKFDPDSPAEFFNREMPKVSEKLMGEAIYKCAAGYVDKKTFREIGDSLGIHPQQVKRHIVKALKWFLENYKDDTADSEGKIVNTPEQPPSA